MNRPVVFRPCLPAGLAFSRFLILLPYIICEAVASSQWNSVALTEDKLGTALKPLRCNTFMKKNKVLIR